MNIQRAAGTRFGICGDTPATLDAIGAAAMTYQWVSNVGSIPEFGAKYEVAKHKNSGGSTGKDLGSFDLGAITIPIGMDRADLGQQALSAAAGERGSFWFTIATPNSDHHYIEALVPSFRPTPGGPDDAWTDGATLELIRHIAVPADQIGFLISDSVIPDQAEGEVATLTAYGVMGPWTFSKVSGNANVSIAANGTVSIDDPISHGEVLAFRARVEGGDDSVVEADFTLTGNLLGLFSFDAETQFPNYQAGLARIAGATGRCRVLLLASSSGRGWCAGTGGAGLIDARRRGYAHKLAGLLTARSLPANAEGFLGAGSGSGITAGQEAVLTVSAGFVVNNGNYDSVGGRPYINGTTSNSLIHTYDGAFVFDSIVTFDQIDQPVVANITPVSGNNVITVNSIVSGGPIEIGMPYISGGGMSAGTTIVEQLTSTEPGGVLGGRGTYRLSANASNNTTGDRIFGMTSSWKYQFGSDPSSAAQSSQGAPAVRSQTFHSGSAPVNQQMRISRQNGWLRFIGLIPYDSTVPAVDIVPAAWPGQTIDKWIDNAKGYGPRAGLIAVAADLYMIQCFGNEYISNVSVDTAEANLRTLIGIIRGIGKDILLITPQPVDEAYYGGRLMKPYIDRMKAVAEDEGLPLYSFYDMLGGTFDPANHFTNDPVHWIEPTHALAAAKLDRVLELAAA